MVSIDLLRERFRNYPGRDRFLRSLQAARLSFFKALPSAPIAGVCEIVFEEPSFSRWAVLPEDRSVRMRDGIAKDRTTYVKRLLRCKGNLVLDQNGRQVFSSGRAVWGSFDGVGREREPRLSSYFAKPTVRFSEIAYLTGAYENNYFHFLYDTMGKVALIERYAPHVETFVIGEALSQQPYYLDALRMGVFGERTIVVQTPGMRVGADIVWIPSPGDPHKEDLLALARRFGADKATQGRALRLYVARGAKAANARRLRNESALFEELSRRGFVFFDPQDHDLATQITTFARAELVVSPHGAGLTNVIWRQGSPLTVVELINPSMHTMDMAYLSGALGYDHHMVLNRGDVGQPLRSTADADIPAVLAIVDDAIAAKIKT